MKRIYLIPLLALLGCTAAAASSGGMSGATESDPPKAAAATLPGDTAAMIVFRFLPADDAFYRSVHENARELERLRQTVGRYRSLIAVGSMPLYVRAYSSAAAARSENLASAGVRANHVKSELIRSEGLREEDFITSLRSEPFGGQRSAVTVTLYLTDIPAETKAEAPPTPDQTPRRFIREDPLPPLPEAGQSGDTFPESTPTEQAEQPGHGFGLGAARGGGSAETGSYGIAAVAPKDYKFALRANLLHWATLTPDLGFEWRMGRSFSLLAHGTWTRWRWNDGKHRFHLWRIAPEFRWYLGLRKRWHLGVEYHTGGFDFKFGETGHRGTFNGGSAVGGYQFDLGRRLSLDLTLGFGGTSSHYREYRMQPGGRFESEMKQKTYIGINQAAVSLGWRFGTVKR